MILPPGRYGYHDVEIGARIITATEEITEELIDRFADVSGDRFDIHMSDSAARASGFDRRVAHGLLVLSVVDGLKNQCPAQFRAIASLGWDWTFEAPVLAGDSVSAEIELTSKRLTRDPERGILGLEFTVLNQDKSVVQSGRNKLMVHA